MTDKDKSFETWVEPETHEQKMERLQLAEEHQTKRAKFELREARQETWQIVGVAFAVAVVIIAIIGAIYLGTSGPESGPSHQEIEDQREQSCIERGGGWVPDDLLIEGDNGICIYPGRVAD